MLMHRGLPQARAFTAKAACCSACFLLAVLPAIASAGTYSGGSGTQAEPFRISAVSDWQELMATPADWASQFVLTADIDLNDVPITPIGNDANGFTGVFDGNDHNVWNFTWSSTNRNLIGLFGYVDYGGEVKNLDLENIDVNVINGDWVGGLAGNNSGTIINCYSSGSVLGNSYVGGLVGENTGSLSDCYSTVGVTGDIYVGGLVGQNRATVLDCHSTGDISGNYDVGGLVGYNVGSVSNCYSIGNVSGDELVGGILGIHYGNASNCYSTGDVSGSYDVGGLVGINRDSISNCYSKGEVNGIEEVGGLLGDNFGSISNCYSTGNVKGGVVVGGLVGVNWEDGSVSNSFWDTDTQSHGVIDSIGESNGGIVTNVAGLPTTQMQIKSTFTSAGWDFIEVWDIGENQTYPFLRTYLAGDINHDGVVDFRDVTHLAGHWLSGL